MPTDELNRQPPVIVVPGIMGSHLQDFYPVRPEMVWDPMPLSGVKDFARIRMHPVDLRYEAVEPARVREFALVSMAYGDLIEALRHELSPAEERPTPVFPFPYDWRQNVEYNAQLLGDFIGEVLERTKLLKYYDPDVNAVDLVAHSMGGLIVACCLAKRFNKARVRRVATIATPFLGSADAFAKLATGQGKLFGSDPKDREREAARSIPAVYQLLPMYSGAFVAADGRTSLELGDVGNWQASIVSSLQRYIDLHVVKHDSLDKPTPTGETLLSEMLRRVFSLHDILREFSPSQVLESSQDWLVIAGVGQKTRFRVRMDVDDIGHRWIIDDRDVNNLGMKTGDGTVPLRGACPHWAGLEELVCLRPEDIGFLEVRDQLMSRFGGFHATLPNVNLAQRIVIKHLREQFYLKMKPAPAPGVDVDIWQPPKTLGFKLY